MLPRRILEALQDRVPPRAFADAQRVLQEELGGGEGEGGGSLLKQFAEFAPLATAAASLAQVGGGSRGGSADQQAAIKSCRGGGSCLLEGCTLWDVSRFPDATSPPPPRPCGRCTTPGCKTAARWR